MRAWLLIISVFVGLLSHPATSQQRGSPCGTRAKYESKNQVDPPPLIVSAVKGKVISETGEPATEIGPVDTACIALFTENGHKLKAAVAADSEGRFELDGIPSGRYRLVVHSDLFCVANVPLRVTKSE